MDDHPYKHAVASVRPELEALTRTNGERPRSTDESARMSAWVALCLSCFGAVSEEGSANADDQMARAVDTREAMLGAARVIARRSATL